MHILKEDYFCGCRISPMPETPGNSCRHPLTGGFMVKRWHWIGAGLVLLLSVPLHFIHDWIGDLFFLAWFFPVNESIWEHLKLLATPMLALSIPAYFLYGKNFPNFLPVRLLSILSGMAGIIVSFYTYTGILGTHFLFADGMTLVMGVFIAYWFSDHFLHSTRFSSGNARFQAQAGFLVLIIGFILFTWYPPDLALFTP